MSHDAAAMIWKKKMHWPHLRGVIEGELHGTISWFSGWLLMISAYQLLSP
jgi:hypothetical protein